MDSTSDDYADATKIFWKLKKKKKNRHMQNRHLQNQVYVLWGKKNLRKQFAAQSPGRIF